MRAQFASGTLTDLQRVNLLEELLQAHERAVEKRKAEARESLMKVSRCPLVWVCSSSPVGTGCHDGGGRRGQRHGAAIRRSSVGVRMP
ncbi:uncharacterized protein LOC121112692 isoform X1 [Gallus gallus]|uniref:uncharacterized protein LOC121112692 isoform X1 n=1 Tax=Gallus gallus TaxID=9031 RepID=UPI001F0079E8|nr:uncharacterized protein LOC121112692 isoform X1 [Gallus gallus]